MLEINWHPSPRELRQFAGIWLPAFAAVFGAMLVYRSGSWTTATLIWGTAAAVAIAGLAMPVLVKPLFVGWMVAAYPIGWTVSHIVLAVTYYGLFTLVGMLMRVFRYDPLERRPDPSLRTHWVDHEQQADSRAYFRQF